MSAKKIGDFEPLYYMANYGTKTTGLPMMIWAGTKGDAKHGPSIKVQRTRIQKMDPGNLFVVSISNSPALKADDQGDITNTELQLLFSWIKLNKESLLKLWDQEFVDFDDFKVTLKKI